MARREDLERIKGLAIVLVVFGHLVARADPAGVDWYEPLRRGVYAFHMPLFLYVSGVVAVGSGKLLVRPKDWGAVLRARARRLLLPFFGLGLTVLAAKIVLRHVMFVDHAPPGFGAGLRALVWDTADSPAVSVWYLFALFVASSASMVVLAGQPRRICLLLAGALLLYALSLPAYGYLDRVADYAVFFVLGACAGMAGARWELAVARCWAGLLVVFAAGLGLDVWLGAEWPRKLMMLVLGALSMPAIHGALRYSPLSSSRILLLLGRASFMIYLFNTLFIGLTKGLLLKFYSWDGGHFLTFAAALMAAGLLGPMALKFAVFPRFTVLDRMTD
jgi:fucose 4-O-acetylase-like acetyltransferase